MNLLEQVRSSCREVAGDARFVRIDRGRLAAYADSLGRASLPAPALDPARHYLGHEEGTAAFIVTLDSINFGSGYFPHLKKRPGMSGYFTVASALTDHFRKHGAFSAEALSRTTARDCGRIFGQDAGNPVAMELMGLFAEALNELGRCLAEEYGGSFLGLIGDARASAERLVRLLSRMPKFNDVEEHRRRRVWFFKRAQLMAADLSLAFRGSGPGRFDDLDRLTIFADNLVPHVLRVDGILRYEPGLAARIDSGELIPAGSPEEVEIRAAAVHAVELLVDHLRKSARPPTAMRLDYLLWTRGQGADYKARPRHRTRTVYY